MIVSVAHIQMTRLFSSFNRSKREKEREKGSSIRAPEINTPPCEKRLSVVNRIPPPFLWLTDQQAKKGI